MKKALFFLVLTTLLFLGCNEDPTPSEELPPGHQQDIAWPSLADSPWPMYHADPQNTGRCNELISVLGVFDCKYTDSSYESNAGPAITKDSLIIIPYHYSLKAINLNGELIWSINMSSESSTTPIVGADGTIYCCYNSIFAISPNGNIKWKFTTEKPIFRLSMNIGKDGALYFTDNQQTFHCLNPDGTLKWKIHDDVFSFGNLSSMSPDGNTIYVNGNNPTLIAVDLVNRCIKWTFGEFASINDAPLIDNEGHIYLTTKESTHFPNPGMYCLNPDKSIRWYFPHSQWNKNNWLTAYHGSPTMDKHGNLYFGSDTLFSLNYSGVLRWKKALKNPTFTSIICDAQDNIYLSLSQGLRQEQEIICYDLTGNIRFETGPMNGYASIASAALAFNKLIIPAQGKSTYIIK